IGHAVKDQRCAWYGQHRRVDDGYDGRVARDGRAQRRVHRRRVLEPCDERTDPEQVRKIGAAAPADRTQLLDDVGELLRGVTAVVGVRVLAGEPEQRVDAYGRRLIPEARARAVDDDLLRAGFRTDGAHLNLHALRVLGVTEGALTTRIGETDRRDDRAARRVLPHRRREREIEFE